MKNDLKRQSSTLIICMSCILVLMIMCYFGISSSKGTYSSDSNYCSNGAIPVTIDNVSYCLKDGYSWSATQNGKKVCYVSYSSGIDENIWTCSDQGCTTTTYSACATIAENDTYTITYDANGGTVNGSSTSTSSVDCTQYLCTVNSFPTPIREGYTFAGWSHTEGCPSLNDGYEEPPLIYQTQSNITVYACWEDLQTEESTSTSQYKVWFDADNGNVSVQYILVENGSTYGELPIPTKFGFTFDGWYTQLRGGGTLITNTSVVNLTGDQTLFANWISNTAEITNYTVTANANGGTIPATTGWTIASNNTTATKSFTDELIYGTLPTPKYDGYIFNGWYTAKSGGTQVTSSTTIPNALDHTLYAQWTKIDTSGSDTPVTPTPTQTTYTVTLNGNGGTVEGKTSVTRTCNTTTGSCMISTLPSAIRTGHTFTGWGTDSSCVSGITGNLTLTTNKTYYACWVQESVIPQTYKVVFDADGGKFSDGKRYKEVTLEETDILTKPNDPVMDGYKFIGWYKGNNEYTEFGNVVTNDLDLIAHYEAIDNEIENPKTGSIAIFVVWVIGIATIIYSFWYFKKTKFE